MNRALPIHRQALCWESILITPVSLPSSPTKREDLIGDWLLKKQPSSGSYHYCCDNNMMLGQPCRMTECPHAMVLDRPLLLAVFTSCSARGGEWHPPRAEYFSVISSAEFSSILLWRTAPLFSPGPINFLWPQMTLVDKKGKGIFKKNALAWFYIHIHYIYMHRPEINVSSLPQLLPILVFEACFP